MPAGMSTAMFWSSMADGWGGKMAAHIEAKDLRATDRRPLHEIVPIRTPFVVYIDPTNLCNFRCSFCPTADNPLLRQVGRPRASMNIQLFQTVVDQLREFPDKLKLLSLYKDGEPMLNKAFPEMVRYAKQANISERIWTKTNASFLNPVLNAAIIDAGLDMIHISIEHVNSEGYKSVADVSLDYENLRTNIRDLYDRRGNCEIYIKIADSGLSQDDVKKFYDDFGDRSTHIAVEKLMGWSYSNLKDFTLGIQSETYDGLPLVEKIACAYPFYVLAVNSDGSVSVCGNDWAYKTVVGNVTVKSLVEIWNDEPLFEIRKLHLTGNRAKNPACGDCYYLKIVPDNIDEHRQEMLHALAAGRGHEDETPN